MTTSRALIGLAVAALGGVAVFAGLAWRAVSVVQTDANGSQNSFQEALASVPSQQPLVQRDAQGHFVRNLDGGPVGPPATQLHVLAYYADGQRLVRADVPLLFLKVKGPAIGYALRGTGFDLETLGLTAGELESAGSRVVLDEMRTMGDRLLVWTN